VIINGCIRDSEDIAKMPLGVKALGTYPLKSSKRDPGLSDVPVTIAGVTVHPGDWVYADKGGATAQTSARCQDSRHRVNNTGFQPCAIQRHQHLRLYLLMLHGSGWVNPGRARGCVTSGGCNMQRSKILHTPSAAPKEAQVTYTHVLSAFAP
jgi:hypothetical protein